MFFENRFLINFSITDHPDVKENVNKKHEELGKIIVYSLYIEDLSLYIKMLNLIINKNLFYYHN